MKIKEYRVFVVENPPPHYGGAYWTFVKLITDSKIEGIGEVYSLPFHPRVVEKMQAEIRRERRWLIPAVTQQW